eukprot:CAMPEP_0197722742 /NCGR_PEP_ID=MMETSP1434-20131217/5334_1 /TAXON_ID=265543 /ORGANISM="Minutocellus polymorphus, Strain CCMP3303" /LENGTH=74 /DNA_ID=CAMNT_0043307933 /DNA_START=48 /DNA_END=269 /DNA_ORIENTATION=-
MMFWRQRLASLSPSLSILLLTAAAATGLASADETGGGSSGGFIRLEFLDVADRFQGAFQDAAARLNKILAFQPT